MANEQNLIPLNKRPKSVQREIQKQGVEASRKKRKEKKTIQSILNNYLDNAVDSNEALKSVAKKAGITGEQSIKELITAVCLINTMKKGDVDKLQKLAEILGENRDKTTELQQEENHNVLIEALRERKNEINKTK